MIWEIFFANDWHEAAFTWCLRKNTTQVFAMPYMSEKCTQNENDDTVKRILTIEYYGIQDQVCAKLFSWIYLPYVVQLELSWKLL